MANTRQIQPTPIWTATGNVPATYLGLINFYGYHFNDGPGTVEYTLIGMQDNGSFVDDEGNTIVNAPSAVDLFKGALEVPASVVQQWGASDEIIFEHVAETLGLVLVTS
jgi:hypothetical protein